MSSIESILNNSDGGTSAPLSPSTVQGASPVPSTHATTEHGSASTSASITSVSQKAFGINNSNRGPGSAATSVSRSQSATERPDESGPAHTATFIPDPYRPIGSFSCNHLQPFGASNGNSYVSTNALHSAHESRSGALSTSVTHPMRNSAITQPLSNYTPHIIQSDVSTPALEGIRSSSVQAPAPQRTNGSARLLSSYDGSIPTPPLHTNPPDKEYVIMNCSGYMNTTGDLRQGPTPLVRAARVCRPQYIPHNPDNAWLKIKQIQQSYCDEASRYGEIFTID